MNATPNLTVEQLRERARALIEESERIIERARQIETETRELVKPECVGPAEGVDRTFTAV